MKIKVGQCRCMEIIYLVEEAGLVWTADMKPLDAGEAVDALLGGRELYRVTGATEGTRRLSTAKPAVLAALRGEPGERPVVVRSHGCPPRAARALSSMAVVPGGPKALPGPPVAPQTPSWGQPAPDRAPDAAQHRSEPVCDDCGRVCDAPGTFWGYQRGETWMYAQHVECP